MVVCFFFFSFKPFVSDVVRDAFDVTSALYYGSEQPDVPASSYSLSHKLGSE